MPSWRIPLTTLALATRCRTVRGFVQPERNGASTSSPTSTLASTPSGSSLTPSASETTNLISGAETDPRVHLVKVGAGGYHFQPAQLNNVSVNDVVRFEFYPPDHSVARAEYESACVPYEYTGKGKTGFWSETQWVDTVGNVTHWNLTINSTEPIFYYCAAPDSCTNQLMVGAINPNSTQTLDAQIRSAQKADFQVAPGEKIPKEASSSLAVPPAASSSGVSASVWHDSSSLSNWAIAGIVLGGVALLVLCAGCLVHVARSKRKGGGGEHWRALDGTQDPPAVDPPSSELYGPLSPCSPVAPLFYSPIGIHPAYRTLSPIDTPQSPPVELDSKRAL